MSENVAFCLHPQNSPTTSKRRGFIAVDKDSPHMLALYEGPRRLIDFLSDAYEVLGDRQAVFANDLTKMFETVIRGKLLELLM